MPTRSEIHGWDSSYLLDAASRWRQMAAESDDSFAQHRQNIAAPEWSGDAKDAALDRVTADCRVVGAQGDILREAATIAENGHADIQAARSKVLEAIAAAEADGFRVGEDLSVTDTKRVDITALGARQTLLAEYAEDIRWTAEQLVQTDGLVGQRLPQKAAELDAVRFADAGKTGVQLVDNVKQAPPGEGDDEEKDPWAPHPDYSNRTNNGKYGNENSRDGKAAEIAALDERERELGLPLVARDPQVRATHPDAVNSETNQPQHRYYDGLEPTGVPDKYIGIEAKTEGVDRTREQKYFDRAVSSERPATATLHGREITIVGTDVAHPPEGWDGSTNLPDNDSTASGPSAGIGGGDSSGLAPIEGGVLESGRLADLGTHVSPGELAKSDDPMLRIAGERLLDLERQRTGRIDPDSIA